MEYRATRGFSHYVLIAGLLTLLITGLWTLLVIGLTHTRQVRESISRVVSPVISRSREPPSMHCLPNSMPLVFPTRRSHSAAAPHGGVLATILSGKPKNNHRVCCFGCLKEGSKSVQALFNGKGPKYPNMAIYSFSIRNRNYCLGNKLHTWVLGPLRV